MSCPANEAAKRAIPIPPPSWMLDDKLVDGLSDYGVSSAREALKPIRAKYVELLAAAAFEDVEVDHGMRIVLDAIAPLIYDTEELDQ